jgi:hypothetical protein
MKSVPEIATSLQRSSKQTHDTHVHNKTIENENTLIILFTTSTVRQITSKNGHYHTHLIDV